MRSISRAIIVLLFFLIIWLFPSAAQGGGARIVLSPQPALVGEGQTTAVSVRVEDVRDLYGLDIRLQFDPNVVEVVDAYPDEAGIQVRPGDLLHVDFIIRNTVDNAGGTIWYALTQVNPSEAVSGSGTAFIITFRGKQIGQSSALAFTRYDLSTRDGEMIEATAADGEIRVVQATQAPPTPTEAPPPPQPTIQMPTPTNTPSATQPTPTNTPSATQPAPANTPVAGLTFTPTATAQAPSPTAPQASAMPSLQAASPTPGTATLPATISPTVSTEASLTPTLAVPMPTLPQQGAGGSPKLSEGPNRTLLIAGGVGVLIVLIIIVATVRKEKDENQ